MLKCRSEATYAADFGAFALEADFIRDDYGISPKASPVGGGDTPLGFQGFSDFDVTASRQSMI
jgi:hypothetical protein